MVTASPLDWVLLLGCQLAALRLITAQMVTSVAIVAISFVEATNGVFWWKGLLVAGFALTGLGVLRVHAELRGLGERYGVSVSGHHSQMLGLAGVYLMLAAAGIALSVLQWSDPSFGTKSAAPLILVISISSYFGLRHSRRTHAITDAVLPKLPRPPVA